MGLKVDVDIDPSTDLLGKYVTDLQEDIAVGKDAIYGTLKYVTGYTGFSGDVAEQSGNYLALHASVPGVEGVTIKCTNTLTGRTVTLDPDGINIMRVTNKSLQNYKFVASKEGYSSFTREFGLNRLTLEGPDT